MLCVPDEVDNRVVKDGRTYAEAEHDVLMTDVVEEIVGVLLAPDAPCDLDGHLLPVATVAAIVNDHKKQSACDNPANEHLDLYEKPIAIRRVIVRNEQIVLVEIVNHQQYRSDVEDNASHDIEARRMKILSLRVKIGGDEIDDQNSGVSEQHELAEVLDALVRADILALRDERLLVVTWDHTRLAQDITDEHRDVKKWVQICDHDYALQWGPQSHFIKIIKIS